MTIIGASLLADYARRYPEAKPALAGLSALVREAAWTCPADIERQFPALTRSAPPSGAVLEIAEAGLRVTLDINYALGLVRVSSVEQIEDQGR
jgi:mRNA-degrading endonuclease HigB of HigAB toxin-antitoxin module